MKILLNEEGDTVRSRNRSMLEGPLFVNIILYTIPIILTSVL